MKKNLFILLLVSILFITACGKKQSSSGEAIIETSKVDLTNLKMTIGEKTSELKKYTVDDFSSFVEDYNNNSLPEIYITEFLFDGVSMVKIYDLDDFIESGNDVKVKTIESLVININTTGDVELSGELTGMIAVNTNNIGDDINLILNGVKVDTDSKKIPAMYIYNKDITYNSHKVTIKTVAGTKNYFEGGKLKKVSLLGSDELDNYSNKYSGDASTWYNTYTNYYGVYTSSQIKNILFASVTADSEDLQDGDPYYFYKSSGAISSDIDLYFEGNGYLEVTSKNDEGIETKGNLEFIGGSGDYVIYAEDDCLNTTTKSSNEKDVHNSLVIDVNSLSAIVSLDADEGDAIDSNGSLVINGGKIMAFSHPGQDAGLDSELGIIINGGTILATGDMYDQVNSSSKQNFMVLSFNGKVEENTLIVLLDENDNVVFSYTTDRNYTYLVYSSASLKEGTYYLYKDGQINAETNSYTKGTILGYSQVGISGGAQTPNGPNDKNEPFNPGGNPDMNMGRSVDMEPNNSFSATNKEFIISGISNLFSGVSQYTGE